MNSKVILLNGTNIGHFITEKEVCVVKASLDTTGIFNPALLSQLNSYNKTSINAGILDLSSIGAENAFVQHLLGVQMPEIGLSSSDTMLPGYYLFKKARLVAYHPGTFDISKLDSGEVKVSLFVGFALAAISAMTQKSFVAGLMTFIATMESPTGINIFQFFKEVLEARSEVDLRKKQITIFLSEIDQAYNLLRVAKIATDAEVNKARKAILAQCHPDKNPDNVEASTKITAQVNEAYELIVNHRKTIFKKN